MYAGFKSSQNLEIVKHFIMLGGVDLTDFLNEPIRKAAAGGHLELVKYFLTFPDVDPAIGSLEVVKVLLKFPGVDPTAKNNSAVRIAALAGHAQVVELLLAYRGVLLRSYDDILFNNSSYDHYLDVFHREGGIPMPKEKRRLEATKILLRYTNVSAAVISERVLCKAVDVCELDVVKLLVEFPGVDVTFDDYRAVREAAFQGEREVLECFMGVPGVDTIAMASKAISHGRRDYNAALKAAACHGHFEVVKVLLTYPGVDPTADNIEAVGKAALVGKLDVVELLFTYPG
ncbi:hypothetical protein HDU76_009159, partial [Blyttiomyces sp. JEL0837]